MTPDQAEIMTEFEGCARRQAIELNNIYQKAFKEKITAGYYQTDEAERYPRQLQTWEGAMPQGDAGICTSWEDMEGLPLQCWACVAKRWHWCATSKKEVNKEEDKVRKEMMKEDLPLLRVAVIRLDRRALVNREYAKLDFMRVYMVLLMGALRANRTLYTQEAVNHWLHIKWDSLRPNEREQYVVSRERITLHFLPNRVVGEEFLEERPAKIQRITAGLTGSRLGGKVKPTISTPGSNSRGVFQSPKSYFVKGKEDKEEKGELTKKEKVDQIVLQAEDFLSAKERDFMGVGKVSDKEVRGLKRVFEEERNVSNDDLKLENPNYLPKMGCLQEVQIGAPRLNYPRGREQ